MPSSADTVPDLSVILHNGLNKSALSCLHCPSRILNPMIGSYVEKEFALPTMTKSVNNCIVKDYLKVTDMFHFENVGFSKNTARGVKYLVCADCEMGPIGWHDIQTKENFVAISRVRIS